MVLSSESRVILESQWMPPGFEEGFAFLLGYTGVCVLDETALAAGVPLLGEGGFMCSSVSAVVANVISRCKDKSHMLRLSKESPVFASGQSTSLRICALRRILFRPSTSVCLSKVERRNQRSSIVVYWLSVSIPLRRR
jgi:hypothetical protein